MGPDHWVQQPGISDSLIRVISVRWWERKLDWSRLMREWKERKKTEIAKTGKSFKELCCNRRMSEILKGKIMTAGMRKTMPGAVLLSRGERMGTSTEMQKLV